MAALALGDAKVVYFGGVSRDATDDDVKALVSTAGKVTNFERRRGYAYAEYASEAEASHAIATLNGKEVSGRTLVVEKSRVPEPRAERPARAPRAEAAAAGGAGAAAPAGEVRYHKDRIVVRNLPAKFDSDALLKVFGSEFKSTELGEISKAKMARGLGVVHFTGEDAAARAMQLSGQAVEGREIRVEYERVKARKPRSKKSKASAEGAAPAAAPKAPKEKKVREPKPAAEAKPARDFTNTLWLGGLPDDSTEESVRALAAPFGAVASVEVIGRSKRNAYVVYGAAAAVDAAVAGLAGKAIEGGAPAGLRAESATGGAKRTRRPRRKAGAGEEAAAGGAGAPAREPRAPREISRVRVDGLPEGTTADQLKAALAAAGRVESGKVIAGRSHGFVGLSSAEEAAKAVGLSGSLTVGGAAVTVSLDTGRSPRPRRSEEAPAAGSA